MTAVLYFVINLCVSDFKAAEWNVKRISQGINKVYWFAKTQIIICNKLIQPYINPEMSEVILKETKKSNIA